MPSALAISTAISRVHWFGSTKKPFVVQLDADAGVGGGAHTGALFSFDDGFGMVFAVFGHVGADAGDVAALQQGVPVEPLEHQLAEVVHAALLQQRHADAGGEVAGQRLGVVVEVDQQRLAEAGLDEAVGVAVVGASAARGARGSG